MHLPNYAASGLGWRWQWWCVEMGMAGQEEGGRSEWGVMMLKNVNFHYYN